MNTPDSRIVDFINQHHVLTLATCSENQPYCAHCFYAYLPDENMLVFTSDQDTRHGTQALENPQVAGGIALETKTIGKIQGLQFCGKAMLAEGELLKKAKKAYLKAFPYAALMKTTLWAVQLTFLKMTHNRLGFGKKLIWEKNNKEGE